MVTDIKDYLDIGSIGSNRSANYYATATADKEPFMPFGFILWGQKLSRQKWRHRWKCESSNLLFVDVVIMQKRGSGFGLCAFRPIQVFS